MHPNLLRRVLPLQLPRSSWGGEGPISCTARLESVHKMFEQEECPSQFCSARHFLTRRVAGSAPLLQTCIPSVRSPSR